MFRQLTVSATKLSQKKLLNEPEGGESPRRLKCTIVEFADMRWNAEVKIRLLAFLVVCQGFRFVRDVCFGFFI